MSEQAAVPPLSDDDLLRSRWRARGWNFEVGEALLDKYREAQRHYHTAHHLVHAFHVLDTDPTARDAVASLSAYERLVVELAIWYHDREYQPRSHHNEALSAKQFEHDASTLAVSPGVTRRVCALIGMSRDHQVPAGDMAAALFCDVDLAILGEPPAVYDEYCHAVRREYAHLPAPLWRWGRRRVLRSLLARPRLFHLLIEREANARANLERELRA